MANYKPKQRTVAASVLTTAGWITGEFHILENGYLVEQLEAVDEFYKLTNASLIGIDTVVPFFALQRDSIELVVPIEDKLLQRDLKDSRQETVHVMFDDGVIRGDLAWRQNIRLSDFVTRQSGFILLTNCEIQFGHVLHGEKSVRHADAVVMNVRHVVGISEEAPA